MVNLMKYKLIFFIFSLMLILPGVYFLMIHGLRLGIDFTGGALLEYKFEQPISVVDLKQTISSQGIEVGQVISSDNNTYIVKTKPLEQNKIISLKNVLNEKYNFVEERRVENVGPIIGAELRQKAILSLIVSSIAIVLYIAFSFRKVPKPASSWRFGIAAIVALLHDVLIVI